MSFLDFFFGGSSKGYHLYTINIYELDDSQPFDEGEKYATITDTSSKQEGVDEWGCLAIAFHKRVETLINKHGVPLLVVCDETGESRKISPNKPWDEYWALYYLHKLTRDDYYEYYHHSSSASIADAYAI